MAGMRFLVSGRVQGVYFRESTRRFALSLNLTGQAVNLPDGTVEVIAWGEQTALDQLHAWLFDGPALAKVTNVEPAVHTGPSPPSFTTG